MADWPVASPRISRNVCSQLRIMYSKSLPACIHCTPHSMSSLANAGLAPSPEPMNFPAALALPATVFMAATTSGCVVCPSRPIEPGQILRAEDERVQALDLDNFIQLGDELHRLDLGDDEDLAIGLLQIGLLFQPAVLHRPPRSEAAGSQRRIAAGGNEVGDLLGE